MLIYYFFHTKYVFLSATFFNGEKVGQTKKNVKISKKDKQYSEKKIT